ncbi:HugZ family protein [Rhodospirillum centenum]|uniref:Uncharacterized protein n=1 Tax=Rhodospirillum centenum (strain ATCC 51521 / SW) TaxID=414684 RepID=B6IV72_RHOCS|nr:DUF2470 domain-containing protein [Rhodospirillum centenum]ACJ00196.1 conserved hypothetical protein [Rhodospirillum centenum SW]
MSDMTPSPPEDAWTGEGPATGRAVMRGCGRAALATAQRDREGWPLPSLVLVALDLDATPLLLISGLAEHTRNLEQDPRAGLLFDGTGGLDEPLTGPRLSVLGKMERTAEPRLRDRFVARHPEAAQYAGFSDFALWRLRPERAHLVAGFGRIRWIAAADLLLPAAACAELTAREGDIIGHMNADHADAVALYATVLLGRPAGDWRLTGLDPEGCDLRAGGASARLPFGRTVTTAEEARAELVRLVRQARAAQPL